MSRFDKVLEDLIWIDLLGQLNPEDCKTDNEKESKS